MINQRASLQADSTSAETQFAPPRQGNEAVSTTQPLPTALADLYAPVADEMAQVERLLLDELRSEFPEVDELVRYGCLLGGKRLRPALLLLAGQAAGGLQHSHIVLGAVVEMIHTATLVHDDILDNAMMRRHLATVNARWDNEASVLLGDYLFTHSFYLASTLETTLACRWIGKATNTVCEGELRQKAARGLTTLSEEQYLSIIGAKTAALCSCSTKLGAHFAGAERPLVEEMERFGHELGIAFQIADDLLDVVGSDVVFTYIRHLRKAGKAVIVCTHRLEQAQRICDRFGLLHRGLLAHEGPLDALRAATGQRDLVEMFLSIVQQPAEAAS